MLHLHFVAGSIVVLYFGYLEFCDKVESLDAGRENLQSSKKNLEKTEEDLKALQSVGQIIGEVLRPLDKERCK